MKNIRKILAITLFYLVIFEVLSFLFIVALGWVRPDFRIDLKVAGHFENITESFLYQTRIRRDDRLGWDRFPMQGPQTETDVAGNAWTISWGPDGAREDPQDRGEVLISTYGDSYTEGAEVDNDQTWQFFLEELTGSDVKNFGVSAYGTGQAFLKLEKHLSEGLIAPVTMLVVFEDDLARAVNNFRFFLSPHTGGKLAFKPNYRYLDGEVRFFPNPYDDDSMTLKELEGLAVKSAKNDYWMSKWLYFDLEFPYTFQIAKAMPTVLRKLILKAQGRQEIANIWDDVEGHMVLKHILESFSQLAEKVGTVPVVVFLPAVNYWKDGRKVPGYSGFMQDFWADGRRDILAIDVNEAEFDMERFSIAKFAGHPSPYGNRVIANHIVASLRKFGVIPAADSN